ncbi:hypothetical protein D7V21_13990 [Acinetobacter guerrae]|uniref:Bacteriophage abortive infection AbiH n=1 Tax=Acinetobacter guerrae TaxID=1843371 RepID=A0A3A8E8K8_9GAMM|nr:AbiH family protein [Acinetobacter guerrae]RKG31352.1 hypothetical protein D7V21_13990 [Acinetobacter guerrae]
MNILIVGNGFDLSHYLPTKYDHFMDVMKAIEEKDLGQPIKNIFKTSVDDPTTLLIQVQQIQYAFSEKTYQMNFDELFVECRDKWFIDKTKEMYVTDSTNVSVEQIIKIQYQLQKNNWYQYFKNHVEEIKTWIDFEQKIEEVLITLSNCIAEIEQIKRPTELFEYFAHDQKNGIRINERNFNVLSFFNFFVLESYEANLPITDRMSVVNKIDKRINLNPKFCHGENLKNGFNPLSFLDYLYAQLEEFIEIFNHYLEVVVSKLQPKDQLKSDVKDWIYPHKIYSFNYTNTYQRFYDAVEVDYLHGSHGEEQNIVLGISELEHKNLIKLKAYGFTKYHQKLLKDTDYLFLDVYKYQIIEQKTQFEENLKLMNANALNPIRTKVTQANLMSKYKVLDLNFYIWGHSLDISDKDYIIDLFSLNDDMDRNVRVTVYYFDKNAKFSLLNNLLAILGKEKVEIWMKKNWLKFEKNPRIMISDSIS